MTFRTERHPDSSRSSSFSELDGLNKSSFFTVQFFEPLQLLLCLFVIRALTLKLCAEAASLGLQNFYLTLGVRELVKRKRNAFTKNVCQRNFLKSVSGGFDEAHASDIT